MNSNLDGDDKLPFKDLIEKLKKTEPADSPSLLCLISIYEETRKNLNLLWHRSDDGKIISITFGTFVLEEDFLEVFNKMIEAIYQYPKKQDQELQVALGFGVNTNWQYCYSKLKDPQLLGLTFRNLKDLHDLYCSLKHNINFPKLMLDEDLLSKIKTFKNVFSKKKEEKVDISFLDLLQHDDSYTKGYDMLSFKP